MDNQDNSQVDYTLLCLQMAVYFVKSLNERYF